MDREETLAKKYLESQGFINIVYEPDGNITPDFLINNEIAVEVRRLNQYFHKNGNVEALESLEFSLLPRILKSLKDFKCEEFDHSIFVGIDYSRPIKPAEFADILLRINEALKQHAEYKEKKCEYIISRNLKLDVFPASKKLDQLYVYAGGIDFNKGGFVVSEIIDSLKIIIPEKTSKISKYKYKYRYWWLVLVDYIGYGIAEDEWGDIKEVLPTNGWDKIIIIPPSGNAGGFEIF